MINGEKETVFELKKGMKVLATVVTDEGDCPRERQAVVAKEPLPEIPQQVGTLLFIMPGVAEPVTSASAEQLPNELPSTGSWLPLIGLVGSLAIATSFGLRAIRTLML